MNLLQYRLDEKLITIFDHLTDEQKIETAIQEHSIQDRVCIFTYYELEQHPYAKKLILDKYRNSPEDLYCYARDMICGRWLEVEPMIMTNTHYAYRYAYDIIKGRWLEAEPIIMTFPEYAYYYAFHVIKGRWPEAEPIIMTFPRSAFFYSRYIIKGRWLQAEPNIMNNDFWWHDYKDYFKF